MNNWMAEAERLVVQRAPRLTSDHAHDLADDPYQAWFASGWSAAKAVAWFFAFMPEDWTP